MSSKQKKRSCPFSSAKGRPKKAKSTLEKEWAAKLAESDKASRAKISLQLQETVEAEKIDKENWTRN